MRGTVDGGGGVGAWGVADDLASKAASASGPPRRELRLGCCPDGGGGAATTGAGVGTGVFNA